jgi:hypothetical protein
MTVNRRHIVGSEAFEFEDAIRDAHDTGRPAVGPWNFTGLAHRRPNYLAHLVAVLFGLAAGYVIWRMGL